MNSNYFINNYISMNNNYFNNNYISMNSNYFSSVFQSSMGCYFLWARTSWDCPSGSPGSSYTNEVG